MRKPLSRESKEMVISSLNFFTRERDNKGPFIPVTAIHERAAACLNVGLRTISTITRQARENQLRGPKRKKLRKKPVCDISPTEQIQIREYIFQMFEQKKHMTTASLLAYLKERRIFEGSTGSLGRILNSIGFRCDKTDPRAGLMELPEIAAARVKFLREYIANLSNSTPRTCVYIDETWVFEHGSVRRSWQEKGQGTIRKLMMAGRRYIILHAGNKNGLIDGTELVFSTSTKKSEHLGEINRQMFLRWFRNQLLVKLEEPSLIIIDNASYYKATEDKSPNASWKKSDILEWLRQHKIKANPTALKAELLLLVARHKPPKTYSADRLAMEYGHQILCLPPYHCTFSPVEKIWELAKSYYYKNNDQVVQGYEQAVQMWQEALKSTSSQWADIIQETDDILKKWWQRELILDTTEDAPLTFKFSSEEESESESNSDESEVE